MADFPRMFASQESRNLHNDSSTSLTDPPHKSTGGLEKEDVVILILSAILVVATLWLATCVLWPISENFSAPKTPLTLSVPIGTGRESVQSSLRMTPPPAVVRALSAGGPAGHVSQ